MAGPGRNRHRARGIGRDRRRLHGVACERGRGGRGEEAAEGRENEKKNVRKGDEGAASKIEDDRRNGDRPRQRDMT